MAHGCMIMLSIMVAGADVQNMQTKSKAPDFKAIAQHAITQKTSRTTSKEPQHPWEIPEDLLTVANRYSMMGHANELYARGLVSSIDPFYIKTLLFQSMSGNRERTQAEPTFAVYSQH